MYTLRTTLTLFFCLMAATAALAAEPSLDDVKAWVRQLAGDDFKTREDAFQNLSALNDDWAPAIRDAARNAADAEVQQRLNTLLKKWTTGGIAWSFEAGFLFQNPCVQNGRVFVMNKDSYLYCLHASSGAVVWKSSVDDLAHRFLAVDAGRVFAIRTRRFGHRDGTVFCLDAETGATLWSREGFKSQNFTGPIACDEKLYFGREATLFCLDAKNGETVWQAEAPDTIESAPTVAAGRVYYGDLSGAFHCLDALKGAELWNFATGGPVYAGAAVQAGRVYLGSNDGTLYVLDADGKLFWKHKVGGAVKTTPAIAAGKIYFGSDDGLFRCLAADDGRLLWKFDTQGDIFASPAVAGNAVYVGGLSHKLTLYCLNAVSGAKQWTFETREAGYPHPVLAGRRLFVGYHSTFYCLRTGENGPKNWPMLGGNAARTSCNDK